MKFLLVSTYELGQQPGAVGSAFARIGVHAGDVVLVAIESSDPTGQAALVQQAMPIVQSVAFPQ